MMKINGLTYYKMAVSAANALDNNKVAVNNMNVFPVPDGDTGINMTLTLSTIRNIGEVDMTLSEYAKKIADLSLRSARGNSGAILSLFFRGMGKAFEGLTEASPMDAARALDLGTKEAYKAVMKPTEGTILTVMRVAAEQGLVFAEKECKDDMVLLFEKVVAVAEKELARTPELLPVLRQARVVDAGGYGFVIILQGMLASLKGEDVVAVEATGSQPGEADFSQFATEDVLFAYCTEFIVDKSEEFLGEGKVSDLYRYISEYGDSIVFVDDENIIKVHIHTNHPGKVLERALKFGDLATVKIENMKIQHSNKVVEEKDILASEVAAPVKPYGFVAVCMGEGITATFKDFGVDHVIFGGQTMNPSTQDILTAINKTPSETVFVFPNNKNIILVANEAAKLCTEKKVIVVPSRNVPQGITALFSFDESADTESNLEAMSEAMTHVTCISTTYAVRDSNVDGFDIHDGQAMGLVNEKIKCVATTQEECIAKLTDELEGISYVTVFFGKGVKEEDAERVGALINEHLPEDADVTVIDGGQSVYEYIISLE